MSSKFKLCTRGNARISSILGDNQFILHKSDDFLEAIKQCRNNFIVIDNADCLINDDVRRFINFELSNQYMLFLQNCDGLNVSDKSFKVLKFDNYRITLAEEL